MGELQSTAGHKVSLKPLIWLLGLLASVLLFAMMVITFIDVFGRYLFSSPLPGAFEMTEMLMGTLIFAGLPLICEREEHIIVSLIDPYLGAGLRVMQRVLRNLMGAGVLGVASWVVWEKAGKLAADGDVTAYLYLPKAPVAYMMSVFCALSVLFFILNLGRIRGKNRPSIDSAG